MITNTQLPYKFQRMFDCITFWTYKAGLFLFFWIFVSFASNFLNFSIAHDEKNLKTTKFMSLFLSLLKKVEFSSYFVFFRFFSSRRVEKRLRFTTSENNNYLGGEISILFMQDIKNFTHLTSSIEIWKNMMGANVISTHPKIKMLFWVSL